MIVRFKHHFERIRISVDNTHFPSIKPSTSYNIMNLVMVKEETRPSAGEPQVDQIQEIPPFDLNASVNRSATFKDHPNGLKWDDNLPSSEIMGKFGFYFTPTGRYKDRVTCFYCNKTRSSWNDVTDPSAHHLKTSKGCYFAKLYYYFNQRSLNSDLDWSTINPFNEPLSGEAIELRKSTFKNLWPHDYTPGSKPTSDKMVEAGFCFFPQIELDDSAMCIYCGVSLEGWDDADDPIEEHRKRAEGNNCYFLRKYEEFKSNDGKIVETVTVSSPIRKSRGRPRKTPITSRSSSPAKKSSPKKTTRKKATRAEQTQSATEEESPTSPLREEPSSQRLRPRRNIMSPKRYTEVPSDEEYEGLPKSDTEEDSYGLSSNSIELNSESKPYQPISKRYGSKNSRITKTVSSSMNRTNNRSKTISMSPVKKSKLLDSSFNNEGLFSTNNMKDIDIGKFTLTRTTTILKDLDNDKDETKETSSQPRKESTPESLRRNGTPDQGENKTPQERETTESPLKSLNKDKRSVQSISSSLTIVPNKEAPKSTEIEEEVNHKNEIVQGDTCDREELAADTSADCSESKELIEQPEEIAPEENPMLPHDKIEDIKKQRTFENQTSGSSDYHNIKSSLSNYEKQNPADLVEEPKVLFAEVSKVDDKEVSNDTIVRYPIDEKEILANSTPEKKDANDHVNVEPNEEQPNDDSEQQQEFVERQHFVDASNNGLEKQDMQFELESNIGKDIENDSYKEELIDSASEAENEKHEDEKAEDTRLSTYTDVDKRKEVKENVDGDILLKHYSYVQPEPLLKENFVEPIEHSMKSSNNSISSTEKEHDKVTMNEDDEEIENTTNNNQSIFKSKQQQINFSMKENMGIYVDSVKFRKRSFEADEESDNANDTDSSQIHSSPTFNKVKRSRKMNGTRQESVSIQDSLHNSSIPTQILDSSKIVFKNHKQHSRANSNSNINVSNLNHKSSISSSSSVNLLDNLKLTRRAKSPFVESKDQHNQPLNCLSNSSKTSLPQQAPNIIPNSDDVPIGESTGDDIQIPYPAPAALGSIHSTQIQDTNSPLRNLSSTSSALPYITKPEQHSKLSEWETSHLDKVFEPLDDLDNAKEYLEALTKLDYDLDDDVDGRITNFINQMPETELDMTLNEWIEHVAEEGARHLREVGEVMIQKFVQESERALSALDALPTID